MMMSAKKRTRQNIMSTGKIQTLISSPTSGWKKMMVFQLSWIRLPVSDIPEPTPFDTFLIIVVFFNF